jgi:hypothetical protein
MACPLGSNYTPKDCLTTAGVKSWYITPFSNVTASTVTSNVVTAITKTVAFKTYAQQAETSTWTYTGDGTQANGAYAYDWEATIKTFGLETADQVEFELLIKNKLLLIAEMNDGTYWMLGRDYGSNAVNDAFVAGTAFNDYQGDTIVIKGRAKTKALKVDSTIIAGLLS